MAIRKAILFAIRKRLSMGKPSEVAQEVFEEYKKTSVGKGKAYKTENEFKEVIKQTIKNVQEASIAKKKGPRQLDLEDQVKANKKKAEEKAKAEEKTKVENKDKKNFLRETKLQKDKKTDTSKKRKIPTKQAVIAGGVFLTGAGILSQLSKNKKAGDEKTTDKETTSINKKSNEQSNKAQSTGGRDKPRTSTETMGDSKRASKSVLNYSLADAYKDKKRKKKKVKVDKRRKKVDKKTEKKKSGTNVKTTDYSKKKKYDPSFLGVREKY